MKTIVASVVAFSCCFLGSQFCVAQSGWIWQHPLPQGNGLNGAAFIDENTGIAVGHGGTILRTTDGGRHWTKQVSGSLQALYKACWSDANTVTVVASNGAILRSTDRGVSWETRLYGGGPFALSDVAFVDQYTGFAVGTRTLLKTSNGGRSWEELTSPSSEWVVSISFCDSVTGLIVERRGNVFFTTDAGESWIPKASGAGFFYSGALASKNRAVAVGTYGNIVKTTDGGDTWVKESQFTNDTFWDIDFVDSSTGYIVGASGRLLKTTDGGDNWVIQSSNCVDYLHGVAVVDPNHACAVGSGGTLLYTSNGGSTWVRQSGSITSPLYSVSFPNKTLGVAVGWSGTGSEGRDGVILRTTDGGKNWTPALIVPDHILRGVSLVDESTGTAVGDGGIILHTTDGGSTWTQQQSPIVTRLYAVEQIDPLTATAMGYAGQVIRCEDGLTWTRQFTGGRDLYGVSFSSPRNGCFVGDDARISITTNGGMTWQNKNPGLSGRGYVFRGVSFFDSTTGYIVGDGGVLFTTTDGGESFIDKRIGWSLHGFNSVTCIDARTAVAVGENMIIRTTDGGDSWVEQTGAGITNAPIDTGAVMQELFSVCFVGGDFGTIVGNGGTIIHTSTGGVTWVEENPPTPRGITLSQNYPNPFNPTTTIRFTLQKPQHVSVIVTDLYGREVRRVIDGTYMDTGSHQVQFDAAGLPSGVYFYTLLTDGQRQTRKMLLLQ